MSRLSPLVLTEPRRFRPLPVLLSPVVLAGVHPRPYACTESTVYSCQSDALVVDISDSTLGVRKTKAGYEVSNMSVEEQLHEELLGLYRRAG